MVSLSSARQASPSSGPYPKGTVQAKDRGDGVYNKVNCETNTLISYDTFSDEVNTLHALTDLICQKRDQALAFGTREVLQTESVYNESLKRDEVKLTLGDYQWCSYAEGKATITKLSYAVNSLIDRTAHASSDQDMHVLMYGTTSAQWFFSSQACFVLKNTPVVTSYTNLGIESLKYTITETEICLVFVDLDLLKNFISIINEMPHIKHVVVFDHADCQTTLTTKYQPQITSGSKLHSWHSLLELGKQQMDAGVALNRAGPENTAVIMYTSGTTGSPKGVVVLHRQAVGAIKCIRPCFNGFDISEFSDVYIAYLPLAHILELMAEIAMVSFGVRLGFSSPQTLTDNSPKIKPGTKGDMNALKPSLMACVPAVLEKIKKEVYDKVNDMPFHRRWIFNRVVTNRLNKIKAGTGIYEHTFLESFIFSKVKAALGGSLRGLICGGAALNVDTQKWFIATLGVPVVNGYASTETCGVGCMASGFDMELGRVGPPKYDVDLYLRDWEEGGYFVKDKDDPKIGVPRGEIVLRSKAVANGYYKKKEQTDEAFEIDPKSGKNVFYTGDIGQIDADGVLRIIDRKKDLVKLEGGEYLSLGKIETLACSSSLVEQCCVVTQQHQNYCIIIIVPREKKLVSFVSEHHGASFAENKSFEELCKDESVRKLVCQETKAHLKAQQLARFEIPEKVILFHELFTPENALCTTSLKLRRVNISKFFKDEIDACYAA